jgi:zinc protease
MLFQGLRAGRGERALRARAARGGTLNGSTWLERTNYYETLPSNQLAIALWLEADRMARLLPAMTQEKLDTQRDVVKNERRWSVDNQPYGTWWERLPALCLPARASVPPLAHRLDGASHRRDASTTWPSSSARTTRRTTRCSPSCGDFETSAARAMVERQFGAIPRGNGRPPLPDLTLPPTFGEWKREVVEDAVVAPRLFLAFRIPPAGDDAWYAASLLGAVLGTGEGSRLSRALVREQQLASEATAFTFDLAKGSDLLVCDVTARPGVAAATLEAAVVAEIDRLLRDGVTAGERARALALYETAWVSGIQSVGARADKLSQFATYRGDAALVNDEPARHAAVGVDAMVDFARARLQPTNRASLLYVPRAVAGVAA